MTRPEPPLNLIEGIRLSGMSWHDLWLHHLSVGGDAGELELEGYVLGLLTLDAYQHDLIAQAINEYFLEHGADHPVEYRGVEAIDE